MAGKREEVISKLKSEGYVVEDINGVIIFHLTEEEFLSTKLRKKLIRHLEELGYYSSWGMRPDKDKKSE